MGWRCDCEPEKSWRSSSNIIIGDLSSLDGGGPGVRVPRLTRVPSAAKIREVCQFQGRMGWGVVPLPRGRSCSICKMCPFSKPSGYLWCYLCDDQSADLFALGYRRCHHSTSYASASCCLCPTLGGKGWPPTSFKVWKDRGFPKVLYVWDRSYRVTWKTMSSTLNPSLDGDKSIGYRLEAESISTFLAASLAVALRLYSRAKYAKLGWDDGIMLFALVRTWPREKEYLSTILTWLLGSSFACNCPYVDSNRSWPWTTSILFDAMGAPATIKV